MKLRNLNGAIRKAADRSIKVRVATPIGVITVGLTKQELMQGFADLGVDATAETGMTIVDGFFRFEDGGDVFGCGAGPADEDAPTFDADEIDLLSDASDSPAADDDLLASDEASAPAEDVEDLLAL